MPSQWMPGAKRHHRRDDGGSMIGGPARAVWHTTEGGRTAGQFRDMRYPSHLVWQPRTGEIVQLIPAGRAGRALENDPGGVQTNRKGRVCIQIEVVGKAARPFTGTAMKGLDAILDWLDSWGIPRWFPAGWPGGVEMYGPNPQRSVRTWTHRGGHYGHSQVPENAHWDPGRIEIDALLGDDMPLSDDDVRRVRNAVLHDRAIEVDYAGKKVRASLAGITKNNEGDIDTVGALVRQVLKKQGMRDDEIDTIVHDAAQRALQNFEARLGDAEVVLHTEENPS